MKSGQGGLIMVAAGVVSLVIVLGCTKANDRMMNGRAGKLEMRSIYPANSATGVPTSSMISMKFTASMDTSSVTTGFHLSHSRDMQFIADSITHMGGMSGMSMDQQDSMMRRMDSLETRGRFRWNDKLDSCTFIPDSPLVADAAYMIFICGNIKSRDGRMMNQDGAGMMGADNGLAYHFQTGAGSGSKAGTLIRISPADGAVEVPTNAIIGLKFSGAVDTGLVMAALHFTGGEGMQMWMDSMSHQGGMDDMMMKMDRMMLLMDSLQIRGRYEWNDDQDSCTFIPDTTLGSNSDHMIVFCSHMAAGCDGSMGIDEGTRTSSDEFIVHFKTGY